MEFISPRDLIQGGAARHGERPALSSSGEHLTYRELAGRTATLAAALKRAGVGPGVQTALMLANSIAYVVWYFAVLEAGGIAVPLAPRITPAEAGKILDTAGVRFLAAAKDMALPQAPTPEHGPAEGASLWRISETATALATEPWTADGFIVRQFSSGSTGQPKHMLKTEANMFHDSSHLCETHRLGPGAVFLGVAPFHHAYGLLSLHTAFLLGGAVSVVPRFLPGPVIEAARANPPAVFMATPPMIDLLGSCRLEDGEETAFRGLKLCTSSTGRLDKTAQQIFEDRFGIPVRAVYGSTETHTATVDLDDGFEEGRVGRPYADVEIGIFDADGKACEAGETGRIGIRSPAACSAYVDDPENTARTFQDGYVFPGDIGYVDDTGCLYVLGRDDVINVGGYKVDRLEVENVIRQSLPVDDVIVLAGERAGLAVIRAVVEADPAVVTRSKVIDACRARLSPHKVPALVEVRERLRRDANGKVVLASIDC